MSSGDRAAPAGVACSEAQQGSGREVQVEPDGAGGVGGADEPAVGDGFGEAGSQAGDGDYLACLGGGDAFARGDAHAVRDPAVLVHDQGGAGGEDRFSHLAQSFEALAVGAPQFGFGKALAGFDQGADGGVQGERGAADVDDAEEFAGARVVDRRGGAVPRVLVLFEVFAA